jgi:hypothetical protein
VHIRRDVASADEPRRPSRLTGRAGVVAQAMLLDLPRAWHVGDLAKAAHASAALVHRVVSRLEKLGILKSAGAGPLKERTVVNPRALLDLLVSELRDGGVERTRAFRLAPSPRRLMSDVAASLRRHGVDYAFSGAAAAQLVTPTVTAVPVAELWISRRAKVDEALRAMNAESVSDGNNLVLQQARNDLPLVFSEVRDEVVVVNAVRLYVDLMRDPRRGSVQADSIRRALLHF